MILDKGKIFGLILLLTLFISARGLAQEFNIDSCSYFFKNRQDENLYAYLTKYENSNKKEDQIGVHLYKAKYYRAKVNIDSQLRHLTLGTNLAKGRQDILECDYLDEWALTYRQDNTESKTKKGLEYINEAIELKKKLLADSSSLAYSYIVKANLLYSSDTLDYHLDSAIVYYKKAMDIGIRKSRQIYCLNNINTMKLLLGDYSNIEYNYSIITNYQLNENLIYDAVGTQLNLAGFYTLQKNTTCFNQIIEEVSPLINKYKWRDKRIALLNQKIFNGFQTDQDYELIMQWQDSVIYLEKALACSDLDEQITKFELDNKVAAAEAQLYKNRFWQSILLGTTLTMILVLIGLYKYLVLKRKTIEDELQHTKTLADLNATKAKMEGEQKERESIAAVLHDQVASLLTAADIHLSVAQKKAPSSNGLTQVSSIIKDINQQVRDLSHQLVSPTLMKFGLEAGIETLTHRMETEQIELHFDSNLGATRYETQIETFVFQSCAELIQNVLKHSSASLCKINLTTQQSTEEQELQLSIVDNGNNEHINPNQPTGLGLTHIYKRAQAMGGSFDFELRSDGAYSILKVPVLAS